MRLTAWMPATRATPSASPLGTTPSRSAATASGESSTRPAAAARRAVTALPRDVDHVRGAVGAHVGEPEGAGARGQRPRSRSCPRRGRQRTRSPASTRSTSAGTKARAVGGRQGAEHVRPLPRPRVAAPVRRSRRPGSARPCPAPPASRASATAVDQAPSASGSRPASRRSAGQDEHVERHEGADRVARQGDHRRARRPTSAAALRHPGSHRDLDEVDAAVGGQHLLDRVVDAHRDAAARDDQVGRAGRSRRRRAPRRRRRAGAPTRRPRRRPPRRAALSIT